MASQSSEPCSNFQLNLCAALGECGKCGHPKLAHVTLSRRGSEQAETVTFIGEFKVNHGGFRAGDIADVTRIGTRYRCVLGNREEFFSFRSAEEATRVLKLEEKKKVEAPKRPYVPPPAPKPQPPKPAPAPIIKLSPWYDDFRKAREYWILLCLRKAVSQELAVTTRPRKYRVKTDPLKAFNEKEMIAMLSNGKIDKNRSEIQLVDSRRTWAFSPICEYFPIPSQAFLVAPSRPKRKNGAGTGSSTNWVYLDTKGKECGPCEARQMTRLLDDGIFLAETKVKRVADKDFSPVKKIMESPSLFCRGTEPEWLLGGRGFCKKEEVPCSFCTFPNPPERVLCCLCREPVVKVEEPPKTIPAAANKASAPQPGANVRFTKFILKEKDTVVPGPGWSVPNRPKDDGYVVKVFPETGECRVIWGKLNSSKHSYANEEVIPKPPPSASPVARIAASSAFRSTTLGGGKSGSVIACITTRFVVPDVSTAKKSISGRNGLALGMFKERAPLIFKDVKKLMANDQRSSSTSLLEREQKLCKRWVDLCKETNASGPVIDGFQRLIERYRYLLANPSDKFRLDEMVSSSEEQRLMRPGTT